MNNELIHSGNGEPTEETKSSLMDPHALNTINLQRPFEALKANVSMNHEIMVLCKEILAERTISAEERDEAQRQLNDAKVKFQKGLKAAKWLMAYWTKKGWYRYIETYIQWFSFDGYDAGFSAVNLDGDKGYKPKRETRIEDYTKVEEAQGQKERGRTKKTKADGEESHTVDTTKRTNGKRSTISTIMEREAALRAKMGTYDLTMWAKITNVQSVLATMETKVIKDRRALSKTTITLIQNLLKELNPFYQDYPWLFFQSGTKTIPLTKETK